MNRQNRLDGAKAIRLALPAIAAALLLTVAGCKKEPPPAAPSAAPAARSAPTAEPTAAAPVVADWCAGHGLPESKCTKCNPELIPKFKAAGDFCEAHGFPESACPVCNPQQPPGSTSGAPAPADWCAGHGLPESKCTKCNPELIPKFKAAGDFCEAHGFPESACPVCNPQQPPGSTSGAPAPADWCAGHGLPETKCTKCNPELIPKFKAAGDYCEAHGFPESACPVCNPQQPPKSAGDSSRVLDWCREHGLPESKCTRCNPDLVSGFREAGDYCEEHGFPESACPVCHPMKPPEPGLMWSGIEIRIRSEELDRAAGFGVTPARDARMASALDVTARIAYHQDRVADVRPLVAGVVREVAVELGASVEAGAPLFTLESAEVGGLQARLGAAKERVSTARSQHQRLSALRAESAASQRDVELASQELGAAKAERRAIQSSISLTGATGKVGRFTVTAPLAGMVVARPAVLGLYAGGEEPLATIADTSVMWVLLDVPEADAPTVRPGQRVTVRIEGTARTFGGTVDWVAPAVDPRTRTVTARATVANPDGLLRDRQLARARIELGPRAAAVAVPLDALQRVEGAHMVFVRKAPLVYEPRVVEPGRISEDLVEVTGSLVAGDPVVVTGAFLLRTELLPGSIGAGCCGED